MATSSSPLIKSPADASFEYEGATMTYAERNLANASAPLFVWAHGWGQNRDAFSPLSESFAAARHVLVDFPGHGQSPPPPATWGTVEYGDMSAAFIKSLGGSGPVNWVGHSFGCRVGVQLASRHPDVITRMCLIAGAGLPRKRKPLEQVQFTSRVLAYKAFKRLPQSVKDRMKLQFGSADYKSAGPMRNVFVKIVNENLSEQAKLIRTPTLLIYGANDTETPPDIGRRFNQMIPGSRLIVLPNQDHYSVLGNGRHIVTKRIAEFVTQ